MKRRLDNHLLPEESVSVVETCDQPVVLKVATCVTSNGHWLIYKGIDWIILRFKIRLGWWYLKSNLRLKIVVVAHNWSDFIIILKLYLLKKRDRDCFRLDQGFKHPNFATKYSCCSEAIS